MVKNHRSPSAPKKKPRPPLIKEFDESEPYTCSCYFFNFRSLENMRKCMCHFEYSGHTEIDDPSIIMSWVLISRQHFLTKLISYLTTHNHP